MSEIAPIIHVSGKERAVLDVVFVHGLTGDPYQTWLAGSSGEFWPKWLCSEFPGIAVYALGYSASLFEKWARREMNIHERAANFLEHFAAYNFGERPIAFVCHSLGGILVKEILRVSKECADKDWQRIATQTRLVAFIATPHTGASLAAAVRLIAPRLSSQFIDLLSNDSGYLTSLNQAFRDLAQGSDIKAVSYYEKWKTKNIAVVVPPESADPGCGQIRPVAVEADHFSICKPKDRDSIVYLSLCRHLKGLWTNGMVSGATQAAALFDADDYQAPADSDRRDLLQKLIDAGREHEYKLANAYQNQFAQKYNKLGLFTDAKQRSDALLSAVEQRFVTHVYSDKICKDASDEEVADALQEHVIDALCKPNGSGPGPSAKAVLQALYFLTEQCYIRWDAP
ncbi:MAG: alpha/beta hydrolase [Rhodoblastus sp.]|nr:alpha/beta hydrolase [Rhodoblastus sp.]